MQPLPLSTPIFTPPVRQHGMVLILTLVMLFIMTMIMISSMRSNISEERMAGNARDWTTAFQAAESALRDAERDIAGTRISGETGFVSGCSSDGKCQVSTTGTPIWVSLLATDPGWISGAVSGTKTVGYGSFTATLGVVALPDVAAQPRYIIEALSVPPMGSLKVGQNTGSADYLYRVTAVGFGKNIASRVMLQGVYRQY